MKEPAREHNTTPGSLPKAVAVGVFIDFAGSLLVAFTLSLIYTLVLTARGYSQAEIERTFSALGPWSALGIVIMLLSLIVSAYAGYQCARVANRATYLAPGIVAMISCAAGAALSAGIYSQREILFLSALSVIAVLGGASVHIRKLQHGGPPS